LRESDFVEESGDYLIVGLGNPGTKYEKTRHNLGFLVIVALAKKHSLSFKRGWRLQGKVASGVIADKKVHLLMPTTYMNLSGTAVHKALHFYKIARKQMLVVVDDVYVTFGAMRLRGEGSPGGHNGLKHIQACLGTQDYPRLRMGVGPQNGKNLPDGRETLLEEYVLAQFSPAEQQILPQVVENGAAVAEEWLKLGMEAASRLAGNLSVLGCK
jgi:PTH1 family peptidyl-tRNA hydrolase